MIKKTKIIAVANQKGGVGKTTILVNLAVYAANLGRNVLIIDTDKQRDAAKFIEHRNRSEKLSKIVCFEKRGADVGLTIRQQAQLRGEDGNAIYDFIFLNVPGVDGDELRQSVGSCHILISPFKSNDFDVWACPAIALLVHEMNMMRPEYEILAYVVPSMITTHPAKEPKQLAKYPEFVKKLKNFKLTDTAFHQLDTFGESPGFGMAVQEIDPNCRAANEVEALFVEVIDEK